MLREIWLKSGVRPLNLWSVYALAVESVPAHNSWTCLLGQASRSAIAYARLTRRWLALWFVDEVPMKIGPDIESLAQPTLEAVMLLSGIKRLPPVDSRSRIRASPALGRKFQER